MKKIYMVFWTLCLSLCGVGLQGQTIKKGNWTMSVGAGLGMSDDVGYPAVAMGAYVGYQLWMFELGMEFHTYGTQTTKGAPHSSVYEGGVSWYRHPSGEEKVFITSTPEFDGSHWEFRLGQSWRSSVNAVLSVKPLALLEGNVRHSLSVGISVGQGLTGNHSSSVEEVSAYSEGTQRGRFSIGPRLGYECLISERIGVGLSVTYDAPVQAFHSLLGLYVHF